MPVVEPALKALGVECVMLGLLYLDMADVPGLELVLVFHFAMESLKV